MTGKPRARRPWFVAPTRTGRAFQLWMLDFLGATASIVSGASPFSSVQGVVAIYGLELMTVGALGLVYKWHWAPAARRIDRRLGDDGRGKTA